MGRNSQFGIPLSFGNISDANGFVKLKIDQAIGISALSLSLKFHFYNYQGWGEIVIFRFPDRLALKTFGRALR